MPFIFLAFFAMINCSNISAADGGMEFKIYKHKENNELVWRMQQGSMERIYAVGDIEKDTANKFEKFVKTNKIKEARIYFNSKGGNLLGGLALGKLIRKLGFETAIGSFKEEAHIFEGVCASACAYAFAGGIHRYYYGNKELLGLHQFSSSQNNISSSDSQEMSGVLVAYLQSMDVDALSFTISTKAQPEEIIWLNAENALKLNLSNNGKEMTTAEIKLTGKNPYLKIEQVQAEVTGRFLIICENKYISIMGGIVTNPQVAKLRFASSTMSYLQFGDNIIQEQKNMKNVSVADSTVWVTRKLTKSDLNKLLTATTISAWLGNDAYMVWGADATIGNVQNKIKHFVDNCL